MHLVITRFCGHLKNCEQKSYLHRARTCLSLCSNTRPVRVLRLFWGALDCSNCQFYQYQMFKNFIADQSELVDRLQENFQVLTSMILALTSQFSVDWMVRQQLVLTGQSPVPQASKLYATTISLFFRVCFSLTACQWLFCLLGGWLYQQEDWGTVASRFLCSKCSTWAVVGTGAGRSLCPGWMQL